MNRSSFLPALFRWIGLVGAIVLTIPFILAMSLDPNPDGLGTHRQLGLPPCSFVMLWQIRCPMCGMTTSWAYLMRGNLLDALRSNPGGVILAGMNGFLILKFLRMAKLRRLPSDREMRTIVHAAMLAGFVILSFWLIRFRDL
ncbi:MAG: DUF2752 domain-containing protein [Planctomycetota bacterium]